MYRGDDSKKQNRISRLWNVETPDKNIDVSLTVKSNSLEQNGNGVEKAWSLLVMSFAHTGF